MDTDGDLLRRTKRPPSASRHSIGPSLRSPHYSPPALHRPGRPRPVPSCPGPDGRCIALGRGTLLVDRWRPFCLFVCFLFFLRNKKIMRAVDDKKERVIDFEWNWLADVWCTMYLSPTVSTCETKENDWLEICVIHHFHFLVIYYFFSNMHKYFVWTIHP